VTITEALRDPALFAPWFQPAASWAPWFSFLRALFGLPLDAEGLDIYRRHTGRQTAPTSQAREAWLVVGRRGGKSRIAATVAVYLACFRDYARSLAPGERGTVMVIAADRRQARVILRYVNGLLDGVPMLAQLVESRTTEAVHLTNRISIEVHTASFRAVRGYTIVSAILDEVAFWRSEDSANPDTEIVNALRPGMATVPGALLLGASSPYARRGVIWEAFRKHHGKDGDPVIVWRGSSSEMNATIPAEIITEAYEADPASAGAEYGAEFRRDIESFVSREAVDAVVVLGCLERPPLSSLWYAGFIDPAGGSGSGDSMTLGISHSEERDGLRIAVLDCVRERKPPFSPDAVVQEFGALLKQYQVTSLTGDRWGGEWVREPLAKFGIEYKIAEKPKSDIYRDHFLPLLNSKRLELLDHPRLITQLCSLERRTARGGRDSIDHGPGHLARDDVINAAAGALMLAASDEFDTLRAYEVLLN